MVRGIEKFKEYFAGYDGNYIIIGGTACDILEENAGQQPRATKDIDIILIVEALTADFVKRFWEFVKAGQYETRQRGNGKHEYFRFLKPQMIDFPLQVEIFARKPDVLEIAEDTRLTPIPIDEDLSSLSAILMNDDYYHFTLEHNRIENGIRLASIESLIVLKTKAFIDLSDRKANGEAIDEKNIRKHKNDVFRLATMLAETNDFTLSLEIQHDMDNFCQMVSHSLPDNAFFKSIGVPANPEAVFGLLCRAFQVEPSL
ncbi:MAG: hypothetical protein LBH80_01825 [Prevotellaceae bacterium]|jgi:hypothetical protein|nr:hypothetical protein [Prevotellaceae bacterium]